MPTRVRENQNRVARLERRTPAGAPAVLAPIRFDPAASDSDRPTGGPGAVILPTKCPDAQAWEAAFGHLVRHG